MFACEGTCIHRILLRGIIVISPPYWTQMLSLIYSSLIFVLCLLKSQVQTLQLHLQGRVFTIGGMAKTTSITRNHNRDDASSRKRVKTFDNGYSAPWSDLFHDVLFLVMMKLGLIDFLTFSGVCKSWRSFALNNKKIYMSSRPPMLMSISKRPSKNECSLQDSEGRKLRTRLPHSSSRFCVGLTCGYLILFGKKTRDFWLVNPVTKHQLHFPWLVNSTNVKRTRVRAILVFSPLINWWVFVMLDSHFGKIWFSIAGIGAWSHVSSDSPIIDLHAFKGKIYAIDFHSCLFEMRINPKPKLTLLQTKNLVKPWNVFIRRPILWLEFVSLDENLYLMDNWSNGSYKVYRLDFDEMKWAALDKTTEEIAFSFNDLKSPASIKLELLVDRWSQYVRYAHFLANKIQKGGSFNANIWYFLNDCLNVNLLEE
ncbi:hypothetical protein LXL04_010470 [Taraxacum kok-saghyz]